MHKFPTSHYSGDDQREHPSSSPPVYVPACLTGAPSSPVQRSCARGSGLVNVLRLFPRKSRAISEPPCDHAVVRRLNLRLFPTIPDESPSTPHGTPDQDPTRESTGRTDRTCRVRNLKLPLVWPLAWPHPTPFCGDRAWHCAMAISGERASQRFKRSSSSIQALSFDSTHSRPSRHSRTTRSRARALARTRACIHMQRHLV